ncbi:MAG: cysteine--tRNA ligase [Ignavibacteriaceae bacterium]
MGRFRGAMLRIYNTLTKTKEEFKPINPQEVKMYMCGPTVYDYFHIGNARSFIMADIIRRYLEYSGYNVKYAMNLTDIDDKIINKANKENKDAKEVADIYSKAFFDDIEKLKIKKASVYPQATAHIKDIIDLIKSLEDKGIAYNINGNVFYDVGKFKEYGKLSGKKLDELESGSRIEINEEKKNPLDFSLWKKAKPNEPSWDSPWGKGRPGWHIECSAMSCRHLGESFDIHAGGNDLIFPHHENEIAQSEASTGKKFVNYWIHFGFLNINEEKMSKSLGNFSTARDVAAKFPAEAIRLFFVQSQYGGPLNFTDELLASAQKGLEKLSNLNERIESALKENIEGGAMPDLDLSKFENDFRYAMDDDFNTPQATAVLFDFTREVNRVISENPNTSSEYLNKAKEFLTSAAGGVLGILPSLSPANGSVELSGEVITKLSALANEVNPEGLNNLHEKSGDGLISFLIEERLNAKKNKNFGLSDRIRDELKNSGIILQDGKDKTTYKIVK